MDFVSQKSLVESDKTIENVFNLVLGFFNFSNVFEYLALF